MKRWSWILLATTSPLPMVAQVPPRPAPTVTVSLAEALSEGRRSSPAYRQVTNDAGAARWQVRNAYASFLPSVDVASTLGFTGEGSSQFGGTLFNQGSTIESSYSLTVGWQLSGATLAAPGQQKANQRAVSEDISNAGSLLRNDITTQYLAVLQAEAQTDVARQQVARNEDFRALADARYQVGQTTLIDVRQAEVTKGQSEVALLRARQAEREAKLELFRRMGISPPVSVDEVALSDSFPVVEPQFDLPSLLALAAEQNPQLRALQARETAADWNVRSNKSRYLPTVSVSATWSGFTQEFRNADNLVANAAARATTTADNCRFQNGILERLTSPHPSPGGGIIADCNGFAGLDAAGNLLPENRQAILGNNDVFPFDFTPNPFRLQLRVALPIFNNFTREVQVSQAAVQREDASEAVRARQLALRAEVEGRFLAVETAYEAITVQQANQRSAEEQMRLARDRFRLGSGSALEVSDAQVALARAEGDLIVAVYDYHQAIAALEFAVGRPLR